MKTSFTIVSNSFKEYFQFLIWGNLCLINREVVYKKCKRFQIRFCLPISSIPYNNSSILIMIISWDYFDMSLANEYVGHVTIPTQVIMYNQCCSRQIRQSDCSIHIKLNYYLLFSSAFEKFCKIFVVR